MKLLRIEKANPPKKFKAIFLTDTGRTKTISFGAAGYDDFTLAHDKAQRDRYRTRHAKDLLTPAGKTGASAGALSYWVLWGDSTSMAQNIRAYRDRYGL